jgi:hypothetical protein
MVRGPSSTGQGIKIQIPPDYANNLFFLCLFNFQAGTVLLPVQRTSLYFPIYFLPCRA